MRLLVQRVASASVTVEGRVAGKIGRGLLVFLGIHRYDTYEQAEKLVKKLIHLRVFPNEAYKMDLDVQDVKGSILLISQFTLYGNCSRSRRPDFGEAAPADRAFEIYNFFLAGLSKFPIPIQQGEFGAAMQVALINDGPVTIFLES